MERPRQSSLLPGEFLGEYNPSYVSRRSGRPSSVNACSMFDVVGESPTAGQEFFVSPITPAHRGDPSPRFFRKREETLSASSSSSAEASAAPKIAKPSSEKKKKPKKSGAKRFVWIDDTKSRQDSQSKQIKQVKLDLVRLLLTTGCHSCLLIIPPSWRVHKFATAGDFNSFLEMYAAALAAQRKMQRHDTKLRIDDVWERFHGRGGLREIESLCSALYDFGCDPDIVEEFKDLYLESIAGIEHTPEIQQRLAFHLHGALRGFIADFSAPAPANC